MQITSYKLKVSIRVLYHTPAKTVLIIFETSLTLNSISRSVSMACVHKKHSDNVIIPFRILWYPSITDGKILE